jgi:hypothetical protein
MVIPAIVSIAPLKLFVPVNVLLPVVAKLPVSIVEPLTSGILTAKVVLSPLVKVKFLVLLLKDAVIKEDAVTDELTNPNAVICALLDIVPAGVTPLPVRFAANIFPEELILVPSKEMFNDCPIPSCNTVIVPGTNEVLVPKCARD